MDYILSTSLIPQGFEGVTRTTKIGHEKAAEIATTATSAVGHAGTATVLTQILGVEVKMNRLRISVAAGDRILAFQLLKRLPEGKVLTAEELAGLEFELRLIEFYSLGTMCLEGSCGMRV